MKQQQGLVIDQNYSNNVLMMVFSTLESLEKTCQKSTKNSFSGNKRFGDYDFVDFSLKNLC